MNELYNKIYEAINNGIQKALIIDPDKDVSVNFYNKEITNTPNLMSTYVFELLEGNNISFYYGCILSLYHETHYKYKIKSINELNQIINILNNVCENISYNWIDCDNFLTFITKNDSEIKLNQISNVNDIEFIKFDNIENCDHPIIIHKYLKASDEINWSKTMFNVLSNFDQSECINNTNNGRNYEKAALNDFNGYMHTYESINVHSPLSDYYVFNYCYDQYINNYKMYVPAIGELNYLLNISELIDFILVKILHAKKLDMHNNYWWSSTEYDGMNAWCLQTDNDSINGNNVTYGYKDELYGYVLPFFKK